MERNRIAFLTLSEPGDFYIYDGLAFGPLAELGWAVEEIPWDRVGVDWRNFFAVIIRSTWDYQDRVDDFLGVLDSITSAGVRLINGVDLVRWNLQKTYLRELQQKGVPIVPTAWLDDASANELPNSYFSQWDVGQVILKPQVGANADDTFRIERGKAAQWETARSAFVGRPCMLQPFVESILQEGEYSLIYFDGQYSHCVVKRPAEGDFRVQEEHGGAISACVAPAAAREVGKKVVEALPYSALYARIDLVLLQAAQWGVIEVELIEPSLYFPYDKQSPKRFAAALDKWLRS